MIARKAIADLVDRIVTEFKPQRVILVSGRMPLEGRGPIQM